MSVNLAPTAVAVETTTVTVTGAPTVAAVEPVETSAPTAVAVETTTVTVTGAPTVAAVEPVETSVPTVIRCGKLRVLMLALARDSIFAREELS